MNGSARLLHTRACDLLEAAHGIAAASTSAGTEPAMPAALACIEEALALLAISADAMRGAASERAAGSARLAARERQAAAVQALEDLAAALREARARGGVAAEELTALAGMPPTAASR